MFKKDKEKKKKITLMDLDEKGSKLEVNSSNSKKEKKLGPKAIGGLKFAKYVVYGFIIFTFAIGILQMLKSKQVKQVINVVEYNFAPSESITAQTYGLAFAKEYLTYSTEERNNEYQQRVMPYMINSLVGSLKSETSKGSSRVVDALVWKVEKLDDNHSNIIVRAEVEITNKETIQMRSGIDNEENSTDVRYNKENKIVYLSVPVGYFEGSYIIDDYPAFIPSPDRPAEATMHSYSSGSMVSENEKGELKEVIGNFFRTYSTGNEGQISYYMENNKKMKGYSGEYVFEDIKTIEAYYSESGTVVAVVQATFKDADLDTTFIQRFAFELIQKSEQNQKRWYIRRFNQRGNLYNQEIL